jgi:Type II secretion system (T2SS), protein E, N-terminal domain
MAKIDPKMIEAIAFFEDMLQTMPKDRTALEFLAVAYEQTEQSEKRRDILVRLVAVLLGENDYKNAKSIAEHLKAFSDHMPAMLAIERVAALTEIDEAANASLEAKHPLAGSTFTPAKSSKVWPTDVPSLSHTASATEMDLVWLWHDQEFVPKELCMDLMNVLTDRPATEKPLLISALAILDEHHPEYTDPVMDKMQQACNLPALPVELFEPTAAAQQVLPFDFCYVKGVMPFALMGNEMLVALLNPMSEELKQEIQDRAGRVGHFFMAHPRSWQPVMDKIMASQQTAVSP